MRALKSIFLLIAFLALNAPLCFGTEPPVATQVVPWKLWSDPASVRRQNCARKLFFASLDSFEVKDFPILQPTRNQIETMVRKAVVPLVEAKIERPFPRLPLTFDLAVGTLSKKGKGNCGECGSYLYPTLNVLFGDNLKVVWNRISVDVTQLEVYPRLNDHVFFVIRTFSESGEPAEPVIIDYSWIQWLDEHGSVDHWDQLVWVGTYEETVTHMVKHGKWMKGNWGTTKEEVELIARAIYRFDH